MNRLPEDIRLETKPRIYNSAVFILLMVMGIMGSVFAVIAIDLRQREIYRINADIIAQSLPINDLKTLSGNESDRATLAYQNTKNNLVKIKPSIPLVQHIYLLGSREEHVFYYVDSELPGNKAYSRPGQYHPSASTQLVSAFRASNSPFFEGPAPNGDKAWRLSAFAPVKDPTNGEVLALVGLDIPASSFYFQAFIFALVPLLLVAIPIAGLIRDRKLEAKEREMIGLKSQFVSIASHELRSPLNGMLWGIQSLISKTDDKENPEQSELLHDMYKSTSSSLATVNEILDFSVFEQNKKEFEHETVNIGKVINEVQKTLKLGAAEKKIQIVLTGSWPDRVAMQGDVAALKRCFMNIIANAIKYSPPKTSIDIAYSTQEAMHVISVSDKGIGIPKAELEKVLEGYYRASNAKKIQAEGTGLGLLVSKFVTEEHGGKLWIRSEEGKGTTIYLSFPKNRARTA